MFRNVKSPFEGEPQTIEGRDLHGRTAFAITARVLSPENAQIADLMAILSVPFLWLMVYEAVLNQAPSSDYVDYIVGFLAPIVMVPLMRALNRQFMHHKVRMEVTDDTFAVSHGGDYVVFDRKLPHSFSILPHDKAPDEQDELDARRRGTSGAVPRRYYTRAYIVTYDYLGQRQDVVAMMGQKEASALHARLVLCDKLVEAQRDQAPIVPLTQSGEWSRQTGDLADID